MKGKSKFTEQEIYELRRLIKKRENAERSQQKGIRSKMRKIGFYGRDDFGMNDLKVADFENLLKIGRIKVTDEKPLKSKPLHKRQNIKTPVSATVEQKSNYQSKFEQFDPKVDDADQIPDDAGNYIVCLRKSSKLPKTKPDFITQNYQGKEVIYVGIAGKSLRKRDYKQHFNGNAGKSTLRKSIGSLFGYQKVPRSVHKDDGKTKFTIADELKLSHWMKNNLILYFLPNNQPENLEDLLIKKFNPPLNLAKNKNPVNAEFRNLLMGLRQ